jgi:RNA polymerase sigma-70 factor (ECF subfamily)
MKDVLMEQRYDAAGRGGDNTFATRTAPPDADSVAAFFDSLAPHMPAVMRIATALVGTLDAEDAAQEALVRAWRATGDRSTIAAPRAWLLRITTNLCTDWARGRFGTRRRVTTSLDAADGADALATLECDPGTSDHTGALDLRRAVNALERDLRVVVALRYYAGLDSGEIGELLGLPAATVRTRLRRALTHLRDQLSTSGTQPHASSPRGDR